MTHDLHLAVIALLGLTLHGLAFGIGLGVAFRHRCEQPEPRPPRGRRRAPRRTRQLHAQQPPRDPAIWQDPDKTVQFEQMGPQQ